MKSQGLTKVSSLHHLLVGFITMNVCPNIHGNPSKIVEIFQTQPIGPTLQSNAMHCWKHIINKLLHIANTETEEAIFAPKNSAMSCSMITF